MTRALRAAPTVLAPNGAPEFGSFRGGLPRMDFGPIPKGRLWKMLHEKRWTYVAVADEHVFAAMAVVSLNYVATAMVFVLDRATGNLLVDRSVLGPGGAASFEDAGDGKRKALFRWGRTELSLSDEGCVVDLAGDSTPIHIVMRPRSGPAEPIAAVVPIEGGYANATEKRLIDAEVEIVAAGRRFLLDRAVAAFDHTAGFLARHTAWRWALGMGFAKSGERVAFNLVEGFVGEPECGGWVGDELFALGEGRFEVDLARPLEPWRVRTTCGSVDLRFLPKAIHAEDKDMLLVRSKFIQPIGEFEGTISLGGRRFEVARLPGVTEHQDVLW
ncbi:MAG: DUF2804 domain-containing protein [Myxococcales bacterium]|nr:DUF2804 domain-containing protein [Myxococcales bacterium]